MASQPNMKQEKSMKQKYILVLSLATLLCFAYSCKETDPPYPDNKVNFSATQLGLSETDLEKTFTVNLDYAETSDVAVVVGMKANGVVFGTDFTVSPAVVNQAITLTIPAGKTSASIRVSKIAQFFEGSDTITFTIQSVDGKPAYGPLVTGSKTSLSLSFSTIISNGATMTLQGGDGGVDAVNSVYVDFSANEQTSAARQSWNLGLYSGAGFAVILNNTTASTAVEAKKQSIGVVVSKSDSLSYASQLAIGLGTGGLTVVDDLDGNLAKSVIQPGKVYIVNLGEGQLPLYKVQVSLKDVSTYTVQYAKLNESSVTSVDVPKVADHDFAYLSFASQKTVSVAPTKDKWDIEWTKSVYKTLNGPVTIPYIFSDFVFINQRNGTQVATVQTASISFDKLKLSDMNGLRFSSSATGIGDLWRSVFEGIINTHYYVVKDPAGNYYKLRFLKMGVNADGGIRGYPEIEYAIIK